MFLESRTLEWSEPNGLRGSEFWAPRRTHGVYVVYSPSGQTVYVGQAKNIAHRMKKHVADRGKHRGLRVTWAPVERAADRNGIEGFLALALRPSEGDRWPTPTIAVNLPEGLVASPAAWLASVVH